MKIRNGFVSNSSSSSFIVHYRNRMKDIGETLLSKEEIKTLKKSGFKACTLTHPSHLDHTDYNDQSIWCKDEKCLSYAKWSDCNQDEETYFLIKNKIPFIATVSNGLYTYLYPRNSKCLFIFANRGKEIETYHRFSNSQQINKLIKEWNKNWPDVKVVSIKNWCKNHLVE